MTQQTWQAPGPGTWERDRSHFEPTVSRLMTDVMEHAAPIGIREGFDVIGAPLDTMDVRFVNGQMYRRLVPVIGGAGSTRQPPAWVTRMVFATVPRLRRRSETARASLEGAVWSGEAERWETRWKAEVVAANRRLAAVDTTTLSDHDLAEHFDRVLDHVRTSTVLHFRLHISDLGPIAVLIDRTHEWGIEAADVMPVLSGASPATSAAQDELRPLAAELAALGVRPHTLDEVRAASDVAADLLDDYLIEFGARLTTGYDITERTLAEMPDVILATLRDRRMSSEQTAAENAAARGAAALAELRERVPPTKLSAFDGLVTDARRLYGLRDENGPLTVEWPCGVLRTAVLETGHRLVAAGRLLDVEHVFDLSAVEIQGSARGEPGPKAEAVATRNRARHARAEADSPPFLGAEPVAPDLAGLPDAMGQMMRMSINALALLEADVALGDMRGTGVGTESYVGRALVVDDPDEALERCEPGDVIITRFTAPTFNSVLGLAGAVVTEHGGLLCHTAVIARELGIPAVVGVAGALAVPDGARVEVDPVAGSVTVLDRRPD